MTLTIDEQLREAKLAMFDLATQMATARDRKHQETYEALLPKMNEARATYRGLLEAAQLQNCDCGHARMAHLGGTTAYGSCCVPGCGCGKFGMSR